MTETLTDQRIDSIINNTPATFDVSANPNVDSHYGEWKALHSVGAIQVQNYTDIITQEAAAQGVSGDLVKAIMYVEFAQGALYGIPAQAAGVADSLYPMNIKGSIWQDLIPGGDFSDPVINIRAGVTLIKRITDRLDNPTVEEIATLYNSTGRELVSDYGARVKMVKDNQLWLDAQNYPSGYHAETASEYFGITSTIDNVWDSIKVFDNQLASTGQTFLQTIALNIRDSGGLGAALKNLFGANVSANPEVNAPTSSTNFFQISNSVGPNAGEQLDLSLTTDYLNGLAVSGGNWQINLPGSILNTNGLFNVAPSSFLTDGWRPGAGEMANYNLSGQINNATSIWNQAGYDLYNDTVGSFDAFATSALGRINNYVMDATNLLNIDPLVLDLNGNGVELKSYQDANVLFNMDADDYKEQTGWVGASDGFLVLDKNGDGVINDVSEMFSEYFTSGAKNGLAALATMDSNHDGVFSAGDAAYGQVRVWQDVNGNGQTDAGELTTLASRGITSISLNGTPGNGALIAGNEVQVTTTMVMNGTTRAVAAINLLANPNGHEWDLAAQGIMLHSEAGTASFSVSDVNGMTVNVAALGVSGAYGNAGNDTLVGDGTANWLGGGGGSDTFSGGAGNDVLIIDAQDVQANIDGGNGFDIVQVVGEDGVNFNLSQAHVELAYGGVGNDILVGGGTTSVFIAGGAGDDIIIGSGANDALSGNDGNDMADGGYGDDVIRGGRGDDLLIGGFGNDIMDGGLEDDVLQGGDGNDVFLSSGGSDTVDGGAGADIVQFTGSFSEYTRTTLTDGRIVMTDRVASRDGTVTMKNVEFFNFKDINNIGVSWDAPMPADDTVTINPTGTQTILASTLLANDVDYQNHTLRITGLTNTVGGTATLNGAGNVVFTPTAGFSGVMSFQYKIADSQNNPGLTATQPGTGLSAEMKGTVTLQTASLPTDPLFGAQWYLAEANILPVWKNYTGKGVTIGVFETDIFDYQHPDLAPNIATNHPNSIYRPEDIGSHATLVAGVIGAARNGQGGIGVAYDAKLAAQKFDLTTNSYGLQDFVHYDIVNNSWNATPAFSTNFATTPLAQDVLKNAAVNGRDGLGTIMVFAAGNDRAAGGDANGSDHNSSRFSIEVGAINRPGDVGALVTASTPFSNPGASILVSAPGSNITSTSQLLQNADGASFGGDYETVQGTSFATPIISGVAALMLEANPNLGYRDVQKILAYSAVSVNDPNTSWQTNGAVDWNGGGLHVSQDYGFGKVDALAAVRLAETWNTTQTAANEVASVKQSGTVHAAIPDGGSIMQMLNVSNSLQVEHVEVQLTLNHTQLGDLIITLIAPDGTQSVLLNRIDKALGSTDAADRGYGIINVPILLNSTHDFGQNSVGTWQLKITDAAGGQAGTLESWELRLYGQATTPNNTYIYTKEFATSTGSSRQTLNDSAGIDTINAAAITTATTINLTAGSNSTIAGRTLTIGSATTIENIYTGDGNDTITGNGTDNILNGGRGNDIINGGGGNDTITGGMGNDTLTGSTGADIFVINKESGASDIVTDFSAASGDIISVQGFESTYGFANLVRTQSGSNALVTLQNGQTIALNNVTASALTAANFNFGNVLLGTTGTDTLNGTSGDDIIKGISGADILNGAAGNDTIVAGANASTINGGDGNDILKGGAGNDVILGNNHNDTIYGNAGNDTITGDDGIDKIYGGDGNDTIDGGIGNDIIYGGNGVISDFNSTLNNESTESDTIHGGVGDDIIHGAGGNDLLYGDDGNDTIYAGNGGDTADGGNGNDTLYGGIGGDTINGGAGNDSIHGEYAVTDTVGSDDVIHGDDGNDIIAGGGGNDVIYGDAGDDDITGGLGNDTIYGGTGNENYMWGDTGIAGNPTGSDRFVITPRYQANTDVIWDFDNSDQNERVDLSAFNLTTGDFNSRIWVVSGVNYTVPDSNGVVQTYTATDIFIRDTAGSINFSTVFSDPHFQVVTLINVSTLYAYQLLLTTHDGPYWGTTAVNSITGSDDNDIIYGSDGDDTLLGRYGQDRLYGGAGNDTLVGSYGVDVLDGGAGNNWADFSDSFAGVVVNLTSAVQNAGTSIANAAYGDTLINLQNVYGSQANDSITGDANDNILDGLTGADTLNGGAGKDTAEYTYSASAVTVNLTTNVNSGGDAQGDVLSNIENLIGSNFNDTLTGTSANNTIEGGAGADTINGGAGIDTASYAGSTAGITVNLTLTTMQSGGDAQGDMLSGIEHIIGSSFNDTLTALAAGSTLDGGVGSDTLNGGAGNDTLIGGAGADTMNGSGSVDTISYASSSAGINVNLALTTAQSGGDAQGDILSSIENLIGSAFDDALAGSSAANTINGGARNDTISYSNSTAAVNVNLDLTTAQSGGFAAGDILSNIENVIGSNFNDTLTGTAAANNINGGTGIDIISYANSAAAVNVNLTLTTAQASGYAQGDILSNIENLTGSNFNDILTGSAVANTINGGAGNDTLDGGNGNDTLTGGTGADVFILQKEANARDVITDFSISTSGEKISLLGFTAAINFTNLAISQQGADAVITLENGQTLTLSNVTASTLTAASFGESGALIGTAGDDILTGTSGNDTMQGLDGNDIITGRAGADTLDGGAGVDTLSYSDSASAVNVNLATGAASGGDAQGDVITNFENLTGSGYNDTLVGSMVANMINGGAGVDLVSYLDSTAGVSVNLGLATVQSGGSAAGDMLSNIENLTGSNYSDTLTGNAVDNIINGGAGNDNINGAAGNDTINGGDGDDILNGGTGADNLTGGNGIDTASYSASAAAVTINLTTNVNTGGDAQGDLLYTIENLTGSAYNDIITGSAANNVLLGGAGADTLDGAGGMDTVSYTGSNAAVVIDLGLATAQSGGHAAGDILKNIENILGSAYNDTLNGTSAANTLDGASGVDVVSYAGSNAAINVNLALTGAQTGGHAQGDILSNVEGLIGSNYNDTLGGSSAVNVLDGGVGVDTVSYANSSAAVTVNLTLTTAQTGGFAQGDILKNIENILGSAYNDTLIGTSAANTLDGAAGIDTVSYASSTAAVNVNLNLATAQTGGDAQGDILKNIENILGSAYNDTLTSNTAANTLDGGAGVDTVSYVGSAAGVSVNLNLTTVQAGSNAAGDILKNIENVLGSSYNDSFVSNAIANTFDGAAGVDTVSYAGSATAVNVNLALTTTQAGGNAAGDILKNIENLTGSAYNDTLAGTSAANTIDGGVGIDTISYANSTAAVNVNLALTTAQAGGFAQGDILSNIENILGSAYNDTLIGTSAANTLDGAAGIDTLSYANSIAGITVNLGVTSAQTGGFAAGDILRNIENINGSNYNDTITGTTASNVIYGGNGVDRLTGGTGADVFKYDATANSGIGAGLRDIITDFNIAQLDKIDLSAFAGTFAFKGTAAFGGGGPQVNHASTSGITTIGVDANGDNLLDFQIELTGTHALTATDFVL